MIRSTPIGRLLCRFGFHRYEWRSRADLPVVIDEYRCRRIHCPLSRRWFFANQEILRK